MTKYHTQFDESTQTIGTTLAGWTHRTAATAPTYVPAYGTPAVKRRYLAHASGQSGELRGLITWDAIDGDANRAKCNLLTCISVDAFTAGTADLWARVAVTGTTITDGYRLRLISGGGAGSFNLSKRVASVTTSAFASSSPTISAGKSYFIRFDLNGTALKAKIWDAALGMAGEPSAWDISTTDSGVSAAGYTGLAMNATAGTVVPWNFFAVGTDGDSAYCPITNDEYLAWLGSQTALRVVTAELSATGYDSGGSPYTKTVNWYIANGGYTSHQQDTPSGKHYDGVITGIPTFRREMSTALSGAAQTGFGALVIANPRPSRIETLRTVQNLINASDSIAGWALNGGATRPSNTQFTVTGTSDYIQRNTAVTTGRRYVVSVDLSVASGTATISIRVTDGLDGSDATTVSCNLTTTVQRFTVTGNMVGSGTFSGTLAILIGNLGSGGAATVNIGRIQLEDNTGLAITAPSDFVSVGVLSSPWHGWGADGIKKFTYANGNTVASNIVTEARGADLNSDLSGTHDDKLRMRWNRNYVKVYLGDPSKPHLDHRLIVFGRLGQPTAPTENTIQFQIADLSDFFNRDINPDLFTSGDLNNSPQPLVFGEINIIEPPLTDKTNLIYTLSKDALYFDTSIGIKNSPVMLDNDVALYAAAPAQTISSINTATDVLTSSGNHGLLVGSTFQFIVGSLPTVGGAALALNTDYFVVSTPSTTTFTISRTRGGAAIDFTSSTSGQTWLGYNWIPPVSGSAPATAQLLATPAGRVTAQTLKDNRYTTTPGKVASVYAAMIFDKLGLSLNYKDATNFDALNADVSTYRAGVWIANTKTNAMDALKALADGTLTWYGITPDGLVQVGRIGLPASSAVMSFTESDVLRGSLKYTDAIRAVDASKARWTYLPWFLTRGPLEKSQYTSPAVIDGKVVVAPPFTGATSTPLDNYPTLSDANQNAVFDTVLVAGITDFQTNTKALYLQTLGIFEFTTRLPASLLNIGDTISLTYPRLGWKNYTGSDDVSPDNTADYDATKAVVLAVDTDIDRGTVKLKVFRRIPGYYPTADLN